MLYDWCTEPSHQTRITTETATNAFLDSRISARVVSQGLGLETVRKDHHNLRRAVRLDRAGWPKSG